MAESSMPNLVILMAGPGGCGKSTVVRKWHTEDYDEDGPTLIDETTIDVESAQIRVIDTGDWRTYPNLVVDHQEEVSLRIIPFWSSEALECIKHQEMEVCKWKKPTLLLATEDSQVTSEEEEEEEALAKEREEEAKALAKKREEEAKALAEEREWYYAHEADGNPFVLAIRMKTFKV